MQSLSPAPRQFEATLSGVLSPAAGTEGSTAARGVVQLVAFAFGSSRAMPGIGWLQRHSRTIRVVGGVMLIAVGVALATGMWDFFVSWIRDEFVSDAVLPI